MKPHQAQILLSPGRGASVGQSARAWKIFDDLGLEGRGGGDVELWCWEDLWEGGMMWKRLLPEGWRSIIVMVLVGLPGSVNRSQTRGRLLLRSTLPIEWKLPWRSTFFFLLEIFVTTTATIN